MRIWSVAVLLFVTLLLTEERAHACSCISVSPEGSYNEADHVVHVRIHGVVRAGHTTRYVAKLVEDDFKGCLGRGKWVVVRTASDSAACGVELERGEDYLLHARAAGRLFKLPILDVGLCDANARWRDLSAEQQSFLDSRQVCCGDDACSCVDGSEPVSCLVDPCQVSSCDVQGATCVANYCGGCNAEWYDESGARVCTTPACAPSGCSGQVCVEAGLEVLTTCEWRPEYACYREAECAPQPDGSCGWTQTPELEACLASPPVSL